MREHITALQKIKTRSGVWRRLVRWKLVYKRARFHLHSPDPHYQDKVAHLAQVRQQAQQDEAHFRVLFADEVGLYRQPLICDAWQNKGKQALKATLSHRSNTCYRVAGALDSATGQVIFSGASKVGVKVLCSFLAQVRAFYGPAMHLSLVWDNWPIHRHEKVLAAAAQHGIDLVWLPTYAPWTNPIEKLWRKLKQEVIYLHRQADEWEKLKERITDFLSAYAMPSPSLLRYVGIRKLTD